MQLGDPEPRDAERLVGDDAVLVPQLDHEHRLVERAAAAPAPSRMLPGALVNVNALFQNGVSVSGLVAVRNAPAASARRARVDALARGRAGAGRRARRTS